MKKTYQVHFYVLKEVEEKVGNLLNYHARRVIEEVVSLSWDEITQEADNDVVDEFYKEAVRNRQVGIYVDKETHRKWKSIPRGIKKQAQFLINKKLYLIAINKEKAKQSNTLSLLKRLIRV
jgi:hypothetical protein